MDKLTHLTAILDDSFLGVRLDQALAQVFPQYSRSRLKYYLEQGNISVNGNLHCKAREKMIGGEAITLRLVQQHDERFFAENIPLDIIYEDDDIIIINKKADLIVHPGAGRASGTLLNALLHHYPAIEQVPRAGIVHRLDKDTTGLMVVAKTIPAQSALVRDLQKRAIIREYEAVACGVMTQGGSVDAPIARNLHKRIAMAVHPMGKEAITHYRVMERFRNYTRLRLRLKTGRTHQIRVHMAHIAHPLLGDPLYGGRAKPPQGASGEFLAILRNFNRQALHALMLSFTHPLSGELMKFTAPYPQDFRILIGALKKDYELHKNELDY